LLVERARGMAFAAGAFVFPGGRIDPADRALAEEIGIEAAVGAAVRETVEETAIPVGLVPTPPEQDAKSLQHALVADQPFAQLLRATGLGIGIDALTPYARWVPKFHAVRRFDTLFYIARCPPGDW